MSDRCWAGGAGGLLGPLLLLCPPALSSVSSVDPSHAIIESQTVFFFTKYAREGRGGFALNFQCGGMSKLYKLQLNINIINFL